MSCSSINNEMNNNTKMIIKNRPKTNKSLLLNMLNIKKISNNLHISNFRKRFFSKKIFYSKNENILLDNFSSFNKISKESTKISENRKKNKISNESLEKYSNAVLFKNRISKHNIFFLEINQIYVMINYYHHNLNH